MASVPQEPGPRAFAPAPTLIWIGRVMSGLVVLFLLLDGAIKLLALPVVGETLSGLDYPPSHARLLGVLTVVSVLLYAWPRTSLLGAILLTGLFGGAMATHLRVGSPVFTHSCSVSTLGC